MSSTRRPATDVRGDAAQERARRFFDEILVPLGRNLQAQGAGLAELAPGREAESFYRPVPSFGRADFEIEVGGNPETLRRALFRQLKDEPALHDLVEKLVELSAALGTDIEQVADVSPFVYVMF